MRHNGSKWRPTTPPKDYAEDWARAAKRDEQRLAAWEWAGAIVLGAIVGLIIPWFL